MNSNGNATGDQQPLTLTPVEVGRELKISRAKVFQLLRGGLPSFKVGSQRRISRSALEAFIARLEQDNAAEMAGEAVR